MRGVDDDNFTHKVSAVPEGILEARAPAECEHASSSDAQSSGLEKGPAPDASSATSKMMSELARAVQWHQEGLLSESEFQALKRTLGLY